MTQLAVHNSSLRDTENLVSLNLSAILTHSHSCPFTFLDSHSNFCPLLLKSEISREKRVAQKELSARNTVLRMFCSYFPSPLPVSAGAQTCAPSPSATCSSRFPPACHPSTSTDLGKMSTPPSDRT